MSANNTTVTSIIEEALRIEEDAEYSSKGQYETARTMRSVHYWLGIPAAVLAALAGISTIMECKPWGGIAAGAAAVLTALVTFVNGQGRAASHHQAGTRYNSLRNQARIFRSIDCAAGGSIELLRHRLDELAKCRDSLNEDSAPPSRGGFLRARKGIENGESKHRVDARRVR